MTEQVPVSLDAETVRQRLEAAFIRVRHLMRNSSDMQRQQYHGAAQGLLLALHEVMLIDASAFDTRIAELNSEL